MSSFVFDSFSSGICIHATFGDQSYPPEIAGVRRNMMTELKAKWKENELFQTSTIGNKCRSV